MIRSRTVIATPPGATIKEQLVDRGMSQKEFAARMDMSEKHISRLINGEVQLTSDVSVRLEMVLGLPAHFWANLENIYREKLAKAQLENEMDSDIALAKKVPYNEMAKNEWVQETRNSIERVINLRKFFEVVQLGLIKDPVVQGISCRKLGNGEKSDYALLAWAQRAKIEARNIQTDAINIEKLKSFLPKIRKMTHQNPEMFCPALQDILASCGVALVFLPHIGGSFLHGAAFYDGAKIVLGMTVRGKDADKFWFSFFHELGHIILGHIGQFGGAAEQNENDADTFSRNVLIPESEFESFLHVGIFDKSSIVNFAENIDIDPGIVVGRLQKEGLIPFNLCCELKTKYELTA